METQIRDVAVELAAIINDHGPQDTVSAMLLHRQRHDIVVPYGVAARALARLVDEGKLTIGPAEGGKWLYRPARVLVLA